MVQGFYGREMYYKSHTISLKSLKYDILPDGEKVGEKSAQFLGNLVMSWQ